MEKSSGQKSGNRLRSLSFSSTDRISDLPNSIVQHILSFLPVKDAIKFCTLSRQWDSLWMSNPNLLFCCEFTQHGKIHRFASFVDKTLMLYASSKINNFSLEFHYVHTLKDKVYSWLRFATIHQVEELCLDFKNFVPHGIYDILFANPLVKKMSLISVDVSHFGGGARACICWTSLKVLTLAEITMEGDMIRSILLGSPLIECLTLRSLGFRNNNSGSDKCLIDATCTSLKKLVIDSCSSCTNDAMEINAPNLLSLTVVGTMGITSLKLVDVSSLVEANIDFWICYSQIKGNDFTWYIRIVLGLLQELRHVNKLSVGTSSLQVLSAMRIDDAIFGTSRWKILKISVELNKQYLPGMVVLLKSSPYLEQLTINITPSDDSEFKVADQSEKDHSADNYWRSEISTFKCLVQNLRSVNVVGFVAGSCSTSEKIMDELMQFLLTNPCRAADNCNESWTSLQPELFK